jgi:glucokinase
MREMKYNIGVEIGATLIQAVIVDKYGRLVARSKIPAHLDRPLPEIIQSTAELIMQLVEKQDLDIRNAKSIGVASPGAPDAEGTMIMKSYVTGFQDAHIKEELGKYFKQRVYVENDAHCAALAESVAGAAEDLDYSITINIGTGVAGGIIINNKIYSGFNGGGAVMAHTVIDKHGKKCYCGRNGCFETVCSAKALIEQTRELAERDKDSKVWEVCRGDLAMVNELTAYVAMIKGDAGAKEIFDEYVDNLSVALINFANLFMPEVIVICGGITDLGEKLLQPVREKLNAGVFSKELAVPMLKLSEMGSASVLVGAAMLGAYWHDIP